MVKITSFNVQGLNSKSKKKKLADNFAKINQLCLILRQKKTRRRKQHYHVKRKTGNVFLVILVTNQNLEKE